MSLTEITREIKQLSRLEKLQLIEKRNSLKILPPYLGTEKSGLWLRLSVIS